MLTIGIADPTRCTAEGKMILMLDGLAETAEGAVRVRVGVRILKMAHYGLGLRLVLRLGLRAAKSV